MEITEAEIKTYIKKALEDHNFFNCEIILTGSTEKSDGYASIVTFATASTTTKEGVKQSIELAVKSSRPNFIQKLRKPYQREAYFYKTILPEFTRFQMQNKVKNVFNAVPKCYLTISDKAVEVIIMENLRKNGYELYDRKKPLNLDHLRLVLREYGKFHAISFALRHKRKEDFDKLVTNFDDVMVQIFDDSFRKPIRQGIERAHSFMSEMNEIELSKMCDKLIQNGADDIMMNLLNTVEPQSAILHGDCWNNNFLYKYEIENHIKRVPSKVAIVDWQISKLHSPVFDLSYFIYTTCSEEQLKYFDELMVVYYSSFSTFLKELGCDPEKLFPFSTLQKHWKKYSLFGVLLVTSFLNMILCDKEDAPDFGESIDGEDIGERVMNVNISDETEFRRRLFAVLNHYYKYTTT